MRQALCNMAPKNTRQPSKPPATTDGTRMHLVVGAPAFCGQKDQKITNLPLRWEDLTHKITVKLVET